MTNAEYNKHVTATAPKTRLGVNLIWSFCVGGLICTLGQGLYNLYKYLGMEEKLTAAAVPVTLVFLAALFTALGVYDKLAVHAGAGTLVPITGFANAMASPAMEFKSEGLVLGLSARMFTITGPVLVFGLCASVLYGVIFVLVS